MLLIYIYLLFSWLLIEWGNGSISLSWICWFSTKIDWWCRQCCHPYKHSSISRYSGTYSSQHNIIEYYIYVCFLWKFKHNFFFFCIFFLFFLKRLQCKSITWAIKLTVLFSMVYTNFAPCMLVRPSTELKNLTTRIVILQWTGKNTHL